MSTTIQVVENVTVKRFVTIDGQRCEVERASFSKAIDEKMAYEELFVALIQEVHKRGLVKQGDDDQWFWVDSGEPIVPQQDWED
ncbi:hypothetical protein [Vibrio vulnificus]|uniref:hypothetical protein n=1 Tax=Vibrio vulnificus TaxID=672 RepID=UPI000A3B51AC|nr:hypothetical protein [Vibrio vulnificus]EKA7348924.1 hypothetical protein [Vibrio vulnificus]MCU8217727.1 hypothetical protein [Vibrio vulnificus]OUD77267.1 hypothetical protein XM73_c20619 [Vibrio vulnificus]